MSSINKKGGSKKNAAGNTSFIGWNPGWLSRGKDRNSTVGHGLSAQERERIREQTEKAIADGKMTVCQHWPTD
jgi:hypothetical protein